jgi:hypothetical protein
VYFKLSNSFGIRLFVLGGVLTLSHGASQIRAAIAAEGVTLGALESTGVEPGKTLEQWGVLDLSMTGVADGNPHVDNHFGATFTPAGGTAADAVKVGGFYDGDGVYRVRFSPPKAGAWTYKTHSNIEELAEKAGEFAAGPPSKGNHGPVRVHNTFHFAYADGEPYRQIGTTCYAWTSQPQELQEQTLKTLASAPFNKLRMCVFPKRYTWNENEPPLYAFEGAPPNQWDFAKFNPAFFRQLERRILQLRDLGIEADLILLHPYDDGHWGFDRMPDEVDDRYLRYVVARLGAFRNVWWSLANEYDFMLEKQESDWDRLIKVVTEADPYDRLTSIHNGRVLYNHTNPRLTHASIQNGSACEDAGRAVLYRDVYRKPIVFDEVKYEGDIPKRWGNLSAREMVHRFWEGSIAGTYVGHGETYLSDDDVLWWSKGGVLKGESPARLAFLRDVLETSPLDGIEPIDKWQYPDFGGKPGSYYLVYLGKESPAEWKFQLPRYELVDGMTFHVDVLDAWNMTVEPVAQAFTVKQLSEYLYEDANQRSVKLPGRPYMALRIIRTNAN